MAIAAAATVAIVVLGGEPAIKGGGFIQRVDISTPRKWCDYYGVEVRAGFALLGKAVGDDYRSRHGLAYSPGTAPEAPDWDGGERECGFGLHFSPTPNAARHFMPESTRLLVCPVRLKDMAVHPDGDYPQKCKASKVGASLWEVDGDGEPRTAADRKLRDKFYAATAPKKRTARKTKVRARS